MSALEMMMKSFGIDPAEIKNMVEKAGKDLKEITEVFHKRIDALEKKIDLLLEINQVKVEPQPQTEGEKK